MPLTAPDVLKYPSARGRRRAFAAAGFRQVVGRGRLLREGRAGSNTTAARITVFDQALAQIPDAHRRGTAILLRSDSAGSNHSFLARIRALREQHLDIRFSVGLADPNFRASLKNQARTSRARAHPSPDDHRVHRSGLTSGGLSPSVLIYQRCP